ncbi:bifunctional riboflavin kinase/FAD synthetase [Serratia microhaemolytica]|uniref:bifunctional riboflavin kinase/FAD synthetase n=1 Tax=Serratia microhaemolytica TaxID=2675110 RepID=UPI000FDE70B4|nr:bifunctional riboflavin kinase/FAD synthetase [Serratia microhaemolytica]
MQLIRGIHNIRAHHRGCVLTIGNFDGIHRGHIALLAQLKQVAERLALPTVVMIFEPQPQELFLAAKAPARLTRLRDKLKYLAQAGVDRVLCVRFDRRFAAYSAHQFIDELLVKQLGVQFLMVGDDFRFSANRQGDFSLLRHAGEQHGFEVVRTPSFCVGQQRVSSTAIRSALRDDNLSLAQTLLGRAYSISGRVVHGDALGRTLGFPTANLPLKRLVVPVKGVYTVDVYGLAAKPLPGVANIGTRPTVSGQMRHQLEVHLLDANIELYGRHLEVVLRAKLRDEQRFASLEALKQQIANDVVAARAYFGLQTPA